MADPSYPQKLNALFYEFVETGTAKQLSAVSTGREVVALHDELIWPEKIVRGDSDHDRSV